MKKKINSKGAAPILNVNENVSLEEQIACRAHELWQERGANHGSDLADWFQAEREVNEWHQKRLRTQSSIDSEHTSAAT
jgi:hypothetical protein